MPTWHINLPITGHANGQVMGTNNLYFPITPVNDAPIADAQTVVVTENTASIITLSGSDIETAPQDLTYSLVDAPSKGTYDLATQTYTPHAGETGADSFTFTVTDLAVDESGTYYSATETSAAATVSITINSTSIIVNTSIDATDANYRRRFTAASVVPATTTDCSLRAAVEEANSTTSIQYIRFCSRT